MKKDTLMFIINPKAGGYKESVWENVVVTLDKNSCDFDYYKTKSEGDATRKVQDLIKEGYRHFVAIGGDGTISEIVNGMMMQNFVDYDELLLSAISFGTGNDWVRSYGQSKDLNEALRGVLFGKIRTQDVGLIHYYQNGEHRRKYFMNAAGFGYDAQIIQATKNMTSKQRGSKTAYLGSLLKCLFKTKKIDYTFKHDNGEFTEHTLSVSVGNGRYTGGAMLQTPDAVIDDGLFDVSVFGDVSKFAVIENVKRLYAGTIKEYKNPHMIYFRTSKLRMEAPVETICEIDGELIGSAPYDIEILKGALRVRI
ncbi:MAG: diacylglycerol kinase family lipid kinase [Paludibacteraceae bacterium]|nr:diacylglycerol kinase family lipid kinase [Paludibacteraceae bacterium]